MTGAPKDPLSAAVDEIAHEASALTEVVLAGQAAGLKIMLAELQMLNALLPGGGMGLGSAGEAAAQTPGAAEQTAEQPAEDRAEAELRIESGFDNMPV